MALEDLTKKILNDAEETAERLKADTRSTVATLEREANEREHAFRRAFSAETDALCAKQATLANARADQEARALIEATQRELLDETFACALDEAKHTSGTAYAEFLQAPLARVLQSTEDLVIHAPAHRLAETQEALRMAGVTAPIETRDDIQSGFVAVGSTSEYDARFEQTLEQVKRMHEPEVARILFET